ncbi:hypothetical protein ONZ43_g7291 [Nemania bipapillata]|uniref:Uncharacterized protein n=1 Tax=Nemania bipapillata TaxID=110536 RepID=A0ACC2HRR3_9PEZI|nr:hypothetical protein ONZ43_g7291 [Nemania bipapillata]
MRFLSNSSRLARANLASGPLSRHAFTTSSSALRGATKFKSRKGRETFHPGITSERLQDISQDHGLRPKPSASQQRKIDRAYQLFQKLVLSRFDDLLRAEGWKDKSNEYQALGVGSKLDFDREVKLFRESITTACENAARTNNVSRRENPLFWALRNGFVNQDLKGLNNEVKYSFQSFIMRSRFPSSILATHQKIADMRFPYEWFPATRALQRTIHLHVGPTNSGKTYSALKALENAKSGIYAGPLRLLAHEVYSRFLAKGKSCALITGEEQRIPKGVDTYFRSCTVEMTPLNQPVDVAIVDEIQMIGDPERGWAWTQALLGVQAKELHLCGEERAVELVQSLCATLGDKCVVHRYQRLSGLETMHESLNGQLKNLQKGDAVVSFTRIGIHTLKKQIEGATGKRAAIVYGSLPPETRAQQAALFNDPNNDYDYLVASDAIGMGLNLEIRRVVFEATHKRDSSNFRQMTVSEIKQIGGRAGRFRTASQAIQSDTSGGEKPPTPQPSGPGLVTALEEEDLAVIVSAFDTEPEPIQTAGIQPPTAAIERLSTYFPPNTPLSFILMRLRDIAKISPKFHLCNLKEMLEIADLIQPFPMSIYDRCVFLNAPVALRDPNGALVLQAFAKSVSRMEGGDLVDMPIVPLELLDVKATDWKSGQTDFLRKLEALHKSITLYLWLSYRFTGIFTSQKLAFHVKGLVEERINELLSGVNETYAARRTRMMARRIEAVKKQHSKEKLLVDIPEEGSEQEDVEEPLHDDPAQLEGITQLKQKPHTQARP